MGSTEVVLISILISTFPFCFCGSDCGCCLLGSVTLAPLTEPPLDHVFVNLADHVGVHVDHMVVLAENFEGFAGEHQFDEQLRIPDGKVKFHERSEERRVGKECRARWWEDHEKKKS